MIVLNTRAHTRANMGEQLSREPAAHRYCMWIELTPSVLDVLTKFVNEPRVDNNGQLEASFLLELVPISAVNARG